MIGCCVVATAPAQAANDIEGAFDALAAVIQDYSGEAVQERYCSPVVCNGYIGNDQFNITWANGGWLQVSLLPSSGPMQTNLLHCAIVIEYATGLGTDGSGLLAGRLAAEAANNGSAETETAGAELKARQTSSGMLECDANRPAPL